MDIGNLTNTVSTVNEIVAIFGTLLKTINVVKKFTAKGGLEFKGADEGIDHLKDYLNYKKSRNEKKRCRVLLKNHNLPKSVGIMCKTENDICFVPNKSIVYKDLNNLHLKSNDGTAQLHIGGGFFTLNITENVSGIVHQKIMNGIVIKHQGDIYLLRHPLGGFPFYLAKLELFINGVIIELNDGSKIGLYY